MTLTKEIQILQQLINEDEHSKNGLYNILANVIDNKQTDLSKKIKKVLHYRITQYISRTYWESKNERIKVLKMNFDIDELITAVMASTMVFTEISPIQPAINNLQRHLGYLEDFNAVQTAADILNCCSGICYDLIRGDKLLIKSRFWLGPEVIQKLKELSCMEAMIVTPKDWRTNYSGGYYSHKTSAILGSKKCYPGYLNLNILNILQQVETNYGYFVWRYDTRGRIYPTGYLHTLYGNDEKRSQIRFKKGELI